MFFCSVEVNRDKREEAIKEFLKAAQVTCEYTEATIEHIANFGDIIYTCYLNDTKMILTRHWSCFPMFVRDFPEKKQWFYILDYSEEGTI